MFVSVFERVDRSWLVNRRWCLCFVCLVVTSNLIRAGGGCGGCGHTGLEGVTLPSAVCTCQYWTMPRRRSRQPGRVWKITLNSEVANKGTNKRSNKMLSSVLTISCWVNPAPEGSLTLFPPYCSPWCHQGWLSLWLFVLASLRPARPSSLARIDYNCVLFSLPSASASLHDDSLHTSTGVTLHYSSHISYWLHWLPLMTSYWSVRSK